MTANDTDTTTAEQPPKTPIGTPAEDVGDATARIDMDSETYQRLREEYERVAEAGYTDGFETFAINQLSSEYRLFVDGEPAEHGFDDTNGRPSPHALGAG